MSTSSNTNSNMVEREKGLLKKYSSHKNIVKLWGTCEASEGEVTTMYLVMELCQGSLLELCNPNIQRRMGENDIALIIWQILNGVEFLHGKNTMHR